MRLFSSMLVVPIALAAAVSAADAQGSRPERPYRGLFANGIQDPEQSLEASASVGGGFDNDVVADALFGPEQRTGELNSNMRGGVGQATGSLGYSLNLTNITFSASGATSVNYYPSLASKFMRRYYGDAGLALRVTRDVSANFSASYMPYSLSSLFPFGPTVGPQSGVFNDLDFSSSLEHYFSYRGGLGYNRRMSKRATFTASYDFQLRDASSFTPQYTQHAAAGRLTFEMGKGLDLRAGYGYSQTDYGPTRQFHSHVIDAGVDYKRALSFSRRTTLSFSTGTTATSNPNDPQDSTQYRLTGGASLQHEMGRTWVAALDYSRGVHLEPAWGDLVSSDNVTGTLEGLLSRQMNFQASARTSTGELGFSASNRGFSSYYGNASLGYALNRHMNLSIGYVYYRHRFDAGAVLPPDFANSYNRHSVRATVSVWAPLMQRARTSHATR